MLKSVMDLGRRLTDPALYLMLGRASCSHVKCRHISRRRGFFRQRVSVAS